MGPKVFSRPFTLVVPVYNEPPAHLSFFWKWNLVGPAGLGLCPPKK